MDSGESLARVLVVMAHPDDAEYFAGGTIALWAAAGAEIGYVVLTSGDKGSGDPAMTPQRLAEIREHEQRAAAELLGVRQVHFLHEPDGELFPHAALRRRLVAEIRRFRAQVVVTMDPTRYYIGDTYINHADHRAAGELALAAASPAAGNRMFYPELLAEGLEPCQVEEVWLAAPSQPNRTVDISSTFAAKVAARRCHASQTGDPATLEQRMAPLFAVQDEHGRTVYQESFRVMRIG